MNTKKTAVFFAIFAFIFIFAGGARAQQIKTEDARIGKTINVWLPDNAERVSDESVPTPVTQRLDQIVERTGGGKYKQYNPEVLIWRGAAYKKRGADAIVDYLIKALEKDGWRVEKGEAKNGLTVIAFYNESIPKSVVGFYIATEDGLLFAWTQVYTD
jgi:hypothetical protein